MSQEELDKNRKIVDVCNKLAGIMRVCGAKSQFDEESKPFLLYIVGEIDRVRRELRSISGGQTFCLQCERWLGDDESAQSENVEIDPKEECVLASSNRCFVRVFPGRDKMVFSHYAKGQYVNIYLTKQTAKKYGIVKGMRSHSHGEIVDLSGSAPCRAALWDEDSGMLHFYSQKGHREGITQRWEMFEPVFTDDHKIIPGRRISYHKDKYIDGQEGKNG